ncbi:LIM domain transcription factor LMO4-B [Atta colombica]|uniref:LIM domain transcription factor LMO4-B n=2 Tax=Attini TaxID=143999 RepID=A0A195BVF5_9HYME|nr:LIM domain transcription factor LMO4-B [Atta colombica]
MVEWKGGAGEGGKGHLGHGPRFFPAVNDYASPVRGPSQTLVKTSPRPPANRQQTHCLCIVASRQEIANVRDAQFEWHYHRILFVSNRDPNDTVGKSHFTRSISQVNPPMPPPPPPPPLPSPSPSPPPPPETPLMTKLANFGQLGFHCFHHACLPSAIYEFQVVYVQEGVPSGSTGLRQCAACGVQIVERWLLLAMDRYWHIGCLKCTYCNVVLGEIGQSCYTKSGMILCKADYRRMFGSSGVCGSCGNAIPANEMVMRAGDSVFHVKCFNCNKCGGQLVSGDRYYLLSGSPICESDWHKIVKSSSVAAAAAAAGGNSGAPVRKGGNPVGRPKKVQPSPQPTPPVVPSPQVDVVDVAVGVDPYSPPPPGHQHYHQYHHHHHHQMALVHPGLAAQQSHLQASSYQDWSSWAQDTCD